MTSTRRILYWHRFDLWAYDDCIVSISLNFCKWNFSIFHYATFNKRNIVTSIYYLVNIKLFSISIYKNSVYFLSVDWKRIIECMVAQTRMLLQYAKQYLHVCETSLRCLLSTVEYDEKCMIFFFHDL